MNKTHNILNVGVSLLLLCTMFITTCKKDPSSSKNTRPTALFTINPTSGTTSTLFIFDASGCTDKEDEISDLQVRWDWENDGTYDTEWNTVKTATHQFNSIGDYTIKLQVKDSDGLTDLHTKSINLSNSAPTAFFTVSPSNGTTSTIFTFDASGCTDSEDETSELKVRWDWDDNGSWDTNYDIPKLSTRQFNSSLNHIVTLEVIDSGGLTDTFSIVFDVSLACGANLVEDTILNNDFECLADSPEAFSISTSNVIFDLGGHTITNTSSNPEKFGILVYDAENVTIKNGSIEGFLFGIDVRTSKNITIENVNIKNMKIASPDTFVNGISASQCSNFNVNNCQFEFPQEHHRTAVISYESNIIVDNIEVIGGGTGVGFQFGYTCIPGSPNHNNGGTVTNSKFVDVFGAGILVECSNGTLIQGNEFIRNEGSIVAYGPCFGSIKNLTIKDNYIHDGFQGIRFLGVTESTISNNIIQNGWRGIWMDQSHECEIGITDNCFYSTFNVISNNIVTGNYVDLGHHEMAIGNTWINNTCQTKRGAEIPDCTD